MDGFLRAEGKKEKIKVKSLKKTRLRSGVFSGAKIIIVMSCHVMVHVNAIPNIIINCNLQGKSKLGHPLTREGVKNG